MIRTKLVFGGLGRRGLEAIVAGVVLVVTAAIVAGSLMVVEGAVQALAGAERNDRPDVVQVKSRFNRALFETPRSGNLPPLTLPVYEPLIDPENLGAGASSAIVLPRQSFLRNVVSSAGFLNLYIFGIEPGLEGRVSTFTLARGRLLRGDDNGVAVIDQASAQALGVDIGGTLPVRKANGQDLRLTVVGVLDGLDFRNPPPRTVDAPSLIPDQSFVSGGIFVTLRTSEAIFGRPTLTDALVVAGSPEDVPSLVTRLREAFRLEPGVFIAERYSAFRRKVHDFTLTVALFTVISTATATLGGSFVANLLNDVYADRQGQYSTLAALGFSPMQSAVPGLAFGAAVALFGASTGSLLAIFFCPRHFAMPSLMADLGTIQPTFDVRVGVLVASVAAVAVILGMAPTAWRLARRPIAATLTETGR